MSSGDGVDIDLYAGDIDREVFQHEEEDFDVGDGVDLHNKGQRVKLEVVGKAAVSGMNGSLPASWNNVGHLNIREGHIDEEGGDATTQPRNYRVCVGGLTWWTSDLNLGDALAEIGVKDLLSVKFYENRTNGQSKGYCILTVGSETSVKVIYDQLPKKEIHGKSPVVTPPTARAMFQFEAQCRPWFGQEPMMPNGCGNGGMMGPRGPMGPLPPGHPMANQFGGPRMMPCGPRMPPRQLGPQNNSCGPPGVFNSPRRPPPPAGPQNTPPRHPFPPQMQQQQSPYFEAGRLPGMPPFSPRGPPMGVPRGPPPPAEEWSRPPMSLRMMGAAPPHGNPAFFNQPGSPAGPTRGQLGLPPPLHFGGPPLRPRGIGAPPLMDRHESSPELNMSDGEFEEVMSRNRSVSSSAICRAVADAASGEFESAVETLVTAVSLIRQSKVASDDRCQILMTALQDTLHGIEKNSFTVRDRSRSRDRERTRSRKSRRESSRSRERGDYGERSRVRYYDLPRERSRSKEREYRDSEATGSYFDEEWERHQRREERKRRGRNRESRY